LARDDYETARSSAQPSTDDDEVQIEVFGFAHDRLCRRSAHHPDIVEKLTLPLWRCIKVFGAELLYPALDLVQVLSRIFGFEP
jgi:hypothetical protein